MGWREGARGKEDMEMRLRREAGKGWGGGEEEMKRGRGKGGKEMDKERWRDIWRGKDEKERGEEKMKGRGRGETGSREGGKENESGSEAKWECVF